MDSIADYVRWRGDLTFAERLFCDLDALVLSQLSYYAIDDGWEALAGRSSLGSSTTLREILSWYDTEKDGKMPFATVADNPKYTPDYDAFFRAAASSGRFGDLIIHDYVSVFDPDAVQFAAICFDLPERCAASGATFVAFRGTDDSIIGWKEDFLISCTEPPAQKMSLAYLRSVLHRKTTSTEHQYYVSGHSKGGNLAMYAASLLSDDELEQIRHIYVLDGPGICDDVLDPAILDRIRDKTTSVVPEYDVVGTLFNPHFPDSRIVQSSETGIMQHAMRSWRIDEKGLVLTEHNTENSVWVGKVLDTWLRKVEPQDRKQFIDDLFGAMAADGAVTMTDITEKGPLGLERFLVNFSETNETTKRIAWDLPRTALFGDVSFGKAAAENRKEITERAEGRAENENPDPAGQSLPGEAAQKETSDGTVRKTFFRKEKPAWVNPATIEAAALMLLGVILLCAPEYSLYLIVSIMFFAIVVFEVVVTLNELRKSHWDLKAQRTRVNICIVMAALYSVLLVKEGALQLATSAIFGTIFLLEAYRSGAFISPKSHKVFRFFDFVEIIMLGILGMYLLVAPNNGMVWFSYGAGGILIMDGLYRFLKYWRKIPSAGSQ